MGMRITTSMMMNTYRYNLQGSTKNLSDARNTVLSGRKFDSYASDPSSATQAWRIRRAMSSNFDYQANNSDTYSRFNIASTTMGVVSNKLTDLAGRFSTITGVDGTIGAGRQPLGQVLKETADTVVQAMNSAKYGDHYVFSGDDEMNPPFSWDGDTLLYRGVNVGAGAVKKPLEPSWFSNQPDAANNNWPKDMPDPGTGAWEQSWVLYAKDQAKPEDQRSGVAKPEEVPAWAEDLGTDGQPKNPPAEADATPWEKEWLKYFADKNADPKTAVKPSVDPAKDNEVKWGKPDQFGIPANVKEIMDNPDSTATDKAWAAYYLDQGDVKKLELLSKEERYVDLGMGLKEDETGLIMGTAFDRSLPGINMLGGYGVDEDGDPKNVVLIMKRIGELFHNSDADSGAWANPGDEEEAMRLLNKLNDSHAGIVEYYGELKARAQYLQQNQTRLETQGDYLQEERVNLEQVDLADAITEFSWDYYCYSAALKIGTQLLSQSLLDYMG